MKEILASFGLHGKQVSQSIKMKVLQQALDALERLATRDGWKPFITENVNDPWKPAEQYGLEAIATLQQVRSREVTDTQLLDFLEKEHFSNVLACGATWYSRLAYGQPHRKHKTLRDAITAAIKQKRKTSPAKVEILRRDPGATFREDGTVNTCLEYGELQDIFNSYRE